MKFSVIMPESGTITKNGEEFPVVYLIGRTENLEKKKLRIPYFPYFYLTEKDYLKLKESGFFDTLKVYRVEGTAERNLAKQLLVRVYGYNWDNIKATVKSIKKNEEISVETYEADLSSSDKLALRYMIDKGIKSGIEVDEKTGEIVKPIDFIVPHRRWYLDFEAYTFKEYTSGISPADPLNMITVFDSYERKLYTYYVKNPKWELQRQEKQVFKPFTKFPHIIKMFDTEAQFLDALMELVREKDPDKFEAWNLNRYDAPKWKQRTDLNQLKCLYGFNSISPLKSVVNTGKLYIKGRILFDLMVAFKQFTDSELASYALAYISKEENLDVEKVPFIGTSGECWDKHPDIVFERNVKDVLILLALDEKYGVTDTFEDKQTQWGCLPSEVFTANRVIDTALMRMVHGEVVLRTVGHDKREKKSEKLLGARVVEPKPDEYEWAFQFDFGAEYPSMIEGFNISPETYVKFEDVKDFSKVHHIQYIDPKHGEMHFCFRKDTVGLIPRLIKFFKAKRKEYKLAQEEAIRKGEPEHVIKTWDRRQYNTKKNTNGIYGVMDYDGFRLKNEQCTQATAVLGRIAAECEYAYLPEADVGYGKGYTLLYGDTDSFFVLAHARTKDELLDEGKKLQKLLQDHLTEYFKEKYGIVSPTELGFKAIYDWIMFIGKKNYAARMIWEEKKHWITDPSKGFDVKGISSVRSDASKLEKASIDAFLRMLASKSSDEALELYIQKTLEDFDKHNYSPMEIAYPAQIKKNLKRNNKGDWVLASPVKGTLFAHYKAAIYSNYYLNTEYRQGDKPRRLPVKFPKLKTAQGQQVMFDKIGTKYPTQWTYKGKIKDRKTGKSYTDKVFDTTDISITEDMRMPKFFEANIDYERIRCRLENKLRSIMDIHQKKVTPKKKPNKKQKKEKKDEGKNEKLFNYM